MEKLVHKVVLITGASSGIGAALAREFVKSGADVVLAARRIDRLKKLAQELTTKSTKAFPVECDVTSEAELVSAVKKSVREFGRLDVVVANAGFGVAGRFEDLSVGDYERQFETNVFGVLRTIYVTLPYLKKTKGRICLIGSVTGHIALPGGSAYAMSKFAVRGLAAPLAHELASHGVSVTHIMPGFVETEIRQVDNKGKWHAKPKKLAPKWMRISAEQAAKEIVAAVIKRERERILTWPGKMEVFVQRHFPWVIDLAVSKFKIANRTEPS